MKTHPFTREQLEKITETYPTPFHIYDEAGIRKNYRAMKEAFAWSPGYRNFYAIKACPNPTLIKILQEE